MYKSSFFTATQIRLSKKRKVKKAVKKSSVHNIHSRFSYIVSYLATVIITPFRLLVKQYIKKFFQSSGEPNTSRRMPLILCHYDIRKEKIKCYLKKFSPRGAKQFLQSRFSSRLGDRPQAYFVYGKEGQRSIGGKMPAKTGLGEAIHCYNRRYPSASISFTSAPFL